MVSHFRWTILGLLATGCLTLAAATATVAPEIKDDGKFFSAEAVKKANERIRLIARKYKRDVLIETYATPPADQVDKIKAMEPKEVAAYFEKWAEERADQRVVHGVYILLCQEPKQFRV